MTETKQTLTPKERFDHLLKVISSRRFLDCQGLGNEVPFFICPFDVRETLEKQGTVDQLIKGLLNHNVKVLKINLYDLIYEILDREGDWEFYANSSDTLENRDMLQDLQGILDVESVLVPAIETQMDSSDWDVLFIDGIGEIFPLIRSHNVLNNLQIVAKTKPTIFFFPGEYKHSTDKGTSLDLFGRLEDDKYYRAFNIYDYDV
jgi:hypothetical protein